MREKREDEMSEWLESKYITFYPVIKEFLNSLWRGQLSQINSSSFSLLTKTKVKIHFDLFIEEIKMYYNSMGNTLNMI